MNTTHQIEIDMAVSEASPQNIAEFFRRDGIIALRNFFEMTDVQEVARELDETVAAEPNRPFGGGEEYSRRFDVKVQVWPGEDKPACRRVMSDARLEEVTEAICGSGYHVNESIGIFSTPSGCGQGWHQDSASLEPDHYELNRILYPTAVMPEQGRLVYVPGSHRQGRIPSGGNHEPIEGEQYFSPAANTLVLMHSRCFHRVEPNQTQRPRTQVNSRARPHRAPEDVCNTAVFRTGVWNFRTRSAS